MALHSLSSGAKLRHCYSVNSYGTHIVGMLPGSGRSAWLDGFGADGSHVQAASASLNYIAGESSAERRLAADNSLGRSNGTRDAEY